MTTFEERAPGYFMTPTDRENLSNLLAKAERISADLADAYRAAQRIVTGTTDLDPHVDLGDPLAMYRLPSGLVGYETTYADQVKVGDWVQRCHGDPDWHLVERAATLTDPLTLSRMVNVWVENDGSYWWAPTDAIRRATPPADVVAAQERTNRPMAGAVTTTGRLDATAAALAHALRANQAHAHPDERVDLTRSPLVDGAFQAFDEAWDKFCVETEA